jgi:hypothetical protein
MRGEKEKTFGNEYLWAPPGKFTFGGESKAGPASEIRRNLSGLNPSSLGSS